MTNKKFSKVSLCCQANLHVSVSEEGTYSYYCASCQEPCDAVSDEGFKKTKNHSWKYVEVDNQLRKICRRCNHKSSSENIPCQPSQNEAKEQHEIVEDWKDFFPFNTFHGETKRQIVELVEAVLEAQAQKSFAEGKKWQKEKDAEICGMYGVKFKESQKEILNS